MLKLGRTCGCLVVVVGFLGALLGLFLCNHVHAYRLEDRAQAEVARLSNELQLRLKAVHDVAGQLGELLANGQLTGDTFANTTRRLVSGSDFDSVEWAEVVAAIEREDFLQEVHNNYHRVPEFDLTESDDVLVKFVHPSASSRLSQVGTSRQSWAKNQESGYGTQLRRHPNGRSYGAYVVVPDKVGDCRGVLVGTLGSLFSLESLISDFANIKVQEASLPVPDEFSDPARFVAFESVGGMRLRYEVRAKSPQDFRPAWWIPWLMSFVSAALAALVATQRQRHERSETAELNRQLTQEADLRTLRERYLQATLDFREQERELIAHEIHDGFVQEVIGAQMFVESMGDMIPDDLGDLKKRNQMVSQVLSEAIEEARRTISDLKPRVVDEVGLVAALESAISDDKRRYKFAANLHSTEDFPRLPVQVERIVFRMVREAISNVRKHAGVSTAEIWISIEGGNVVAEVIDTGCGFSVELVPNECFGLAGIRERARFLQGKATISSSARGTKVHIQLPLGVEATPLSPPINDSARIVIRTDQDSSGVSPKRFA